MKIISVIPARSGSKGIKNKNTIVVNNKPLIEYSFIHAQKSKIKNNFVLTDSKKIKLIAKKYKINSDYIRPDNKSKDKTPSSNVKTSGFGPSQSSRSRGVRKISSFSISKVPMVSLS